MTDDFGSAPTGVEVGVHALRTFDVQGKKLTSIVQGGGNWEDGVCVAHCTVNADHEAPAEGCSCGIYAFFGVDELVSQYREWARKIVAVIAAEGLTTIGTLGLKTAAARIVAYWCVDDIALVCAASSPGARRFYDRDVMVLLYGLNGEPPREGE